MNQLINHIATKHIQRELYRGWAIFMTALLAVQSVAGFAPAVTATGTPTPPPLTTCTLYGYNDQDLDDSRLFQMNLQSGVSSYIGSTATNEDIEAIDTQPSTGTVYGFPDNGSDDTSAVLVTVNRATGGRTFVANVSSEFELPGASFNPVTGELWASADTNDNLYTINLATGAPTLKLDASKSGEPQALAWNNAGTTLYVAYDNVIYTTDGTSALSQLADVGGEVEAMEFDELGNLLVGKHGSANLYVLVGSSLVDTGLNFIGNDVETLTTACPEEPPTGSVKVDKKADTDGNGTFESGNDTANELGFRWGLDSASPNRLMGSSADAAPGDHEVSENTVPGFHFVGWFLSGNSESNGDHDPDNEEDRAGLASDTALSGEEDDDDDDGEQFSCQNPQGTTLPATFSIGTGGGDDDDADNEEDRAGLASDTALSEDDDDDDDDGGDNHHGNVTVTLCNARSTGTLRVIKHVVGEAPASDWQLHVKRDGVDVSGSPQSGSENGTLYTLPTDSYLVSETGGPAGFTQAFSGDCNADGRVTVVAGQEKTCTLTNTENPPEETSLTVIKHVVGGSDQAADWTMHIKQGETKVFSFAGSEAPGTTKALSPGSYRVTETGGPNGYALAYSGDCNTDGNVTLSAGQHKTCTVTNTREQGRIKIVKVLSDESDPNAWTFTISGHAGDVHHNEFVTLDTGNYTVAEHGPQGYTLTDASGICSIIESQVRLHVTTDNGTCTITNTKNPIPPQLTVVKHVVGSDKPASDFTMHVAGQSFPGNEQGSTRTLDPGTYTVTETNADGFVLTYSGDCNSEGQIVLGLGQDATCVLTNTFPVPPDLGVSKTDGLTTATPGQTVTYTMVVRNVGEAAAENVTASDLLPPQANYVSSTFEGAPAVATVTPNPAGDLLNWSLGTFSPGVQKTLTVTVTLDSVFPSGTTVLTNIITVATSTPEPNVLNNSASDVTNVSAGPSIAITKTDSPDPVSAGQTIGYTIHWSVVGNAAASSLTITDPIPANTTFVSADTGGTYNATTKTVTWLLGTKAPGENGNVGLVVRVVSPIVNATLITNVATIDSTETDPTTATAVTTVTSAPALSIAKTSKVTTFVNPGATVEYTVTVTNAATATDTARNVVMTDTLPAGLTFEDGTTVKTFALGNIAPGESKIVTFLAKVGTATVAGTYTNTGKAKGDNTPEVTATAPVEVRLPTVLAVTANPELKITKTVNKEFVNPGDVVEYRVRVENVGEATAVNVTVNDTLPKGFTFQDGGAATKRFAIGDLDPGQSFLLTYKVTVGKAVKAGRYENAAVAKADNAPIVTAKAPLEVRGIKVLATTGTGLVDWLIVMFGAGIVLTGLTLLFKLRRPEDQLV